jgi:hypothetical protein
MHVGKDLIPRVVNIPLDIWQAEVVLLLFIGEATRSPVISLKPPA